MYRSRKPQKNVSKRAKNPIDFFRRRLFEDSEHEAFFLVLGEADCKLVCWNSVGRCPFLIHDVGGRNERWQQIGNFRDTMIRYLVRGYKMQNRPGPPPKPPGRSGRNR